MLVLTGAMAAAAAKSAMVANGQSLRDRGTKGAIAAADAGLEVGMYRLNKFAAALDESQPCVTVNALTGSVGIEAVLPDGWCREQSEQLAEGGSFTYRISAPIRTDAEGQDVWEREVVSTGIVGSLKRRIVARVHAPTGQALFSDAVFSHEDLPLMNMARVQGNVRSNGNITTLNNSLICGNVTVGPGRSFTGGNQCAGFASRTADEEFVLSPVVMPDENDNAQIGNQDPWTDPQQITWSQASRALRLTQSATLTLTGDVYVFCSLVLENSSQLIIPDDGTPVRIYIDSPENCGGNALSVGLYNGSNLTNASGDPTMLQLYVAGSANVATNVEFHNLHELVLVLYAPNSGVSFDNHNRLRGAVAARRVALRNNLLITWDPRAGSLFLPDVPLPVYQRQQWTECPPASAGLPPSSGC